MLGLNHLLLKANDSPSKDGETKLRYRVFWGIIQNIEVNKKTSQKALLRLQMQADDDEDDDDGEEEESETAVFQMKDRTTLLDLKKDIQERMKQFRGGTSTMEIKDVSMMSVMGDSSQQSSSRVRFSSTTVEIHPDVLVAPPAAARDGSAKEPARRTVSAPMPPSSSTMANSSPRKQKGLRNRAAQNPGAVPVMEPNGATSQQAGSGNQPSASMSAAPKSPQREKGLRSNNAPTNHPGAVRPQNTNRKKKGLRNAAAAAANNPGAVSAVSRSSITVPAPTRHEEPPASPNHGQGVAAEEGTTTTKRKSETDEETASVRPADSVRDPSALMVVATLVPDDEEEEDRDDSDKILVEAHEVEIPDLICDRRMKVILAILVVLVVLVVIISVSVVLSSSSSSPEEQAAIVDRDMARRQAREWVENHPEAGTFEPWRADQLLALATLSFAMNAPADWLDANTHECEWPLPDIDRQKPRCSVGGRYRVLDLERAATDPGFIPSEIALLKELTIVDLIGNDLYGELPSEISELVSLTKLSADRNDLDGPIPSELGLLTNLNFVSLDQNDLESTIPSELMALTKMELLSIGGNRISGTIPSRLGELSQLSELALARNKLSGQIPTAVGKLTLLISLDLSSNDLVTSIPSEIALLSQLERLDLRDNKFTGSFPLELALLLGNTSNTLDDESTKGLVLVSTELQANPPDASAPTPSPEAIGRITGAPTTTAVPAVIQYLETLQVTSAGVFEDPGSPQYRAAVWVAEGDSYAFSMGLSIEEPKLLQRYALAVFYHATGGDNWKFCGKNSPSCGDTQWLSVTDECEWFSLSCDESGAIFQISFPATGIDLNGILPAELSLLAGLKRFLAPENALSGDLDVAFGSLTSLESIALPDNRLEGAIPTGILEMNQGLGLLALGGNQFSGPIPNGITKASRLHDLQLPFNAITGTIPIGMGNLTNLVNLEIQRNRIVGSIPDALFSLTNLRSLSLRENAGISGGISPLISQLTSLSVVQMGFTGLEGSLPQELFELTDLSELNLENAGFSGTIHEAIRQLNASLMDLFLNFNAFSGPVPEAFDHLTALETLQIQGNLLTGSISSAVCAERGLRFQQLSRLIVDCEVQCTCCDNSDNCEE
ncbi:Leucine Rich Repeat [Seminavis robusta]|uniref:Leucine Rich Repeat n=1 Tax=Seminavis robusta TaxID=568900 RepID=A0A9N8EL76_9STRA|nr:Leucine Rich Repeat [Seminavis robusta]|eukprot:Sro1378_g267640.1 Leucine Rich Repeat (1122) ;mRNA; r:13468-17119